MDLKDKNLLIITNSYPDKNNNHYGGIFVKEQVRYLSEHFNEVYVISPQPLGYRRELEDYSHDNVRVYYPRFFHLPVKFFRKRLGTSFFRAVLRVIKREKLRFDLIHAHFTWPSGYAGVLLKNAFKKPLVVTPHGNDIRIPLTNYVKSFDNFFLKETLDNVVTFADLILTHHEELFDLLINFYPDCRSKINFLYKGIPLGRFDPFSSELQRRADELRESLGIGNKFVVLFLSRVDWDKDPLTFINASNILREYDDIVFVMVGDGKLRKECLKFKNKHNLHNLYIMGSRSDTEVWYAMADVFVALSPVENIWSTTLQEAFCMGIPSVVTKVGYTPKILRHLKDAVLIPPKDPKALADAILLLKDDIELREKLTKNVLKWRKRFNYANISREILELYNTILENQIL